MNQFFLTIDHLRDSNVLTLKNVPNQLIYIIKKVSELNNEQLHPEELKFILKSCKKRQNEFIAGRILSKYILSVLGVDNFPLLVGKFREPLWPDGIVGSISHCSDYCFVAASKSSNFHSIGVDIEKNSPLSNKLEDIVCTNSELNWIKSMVDSGCSLPLSKMIFSAKESAYKCIFPIVERFVDFKEAEVIFTISNNSFNVDMLNANKEHELSGEQFNIRGCFSIDQSNIYSLAFLPN